MRGCFAVSSKRRAFSTTPRWEEQRKELQSIHALQAECPEATFTDSDPCLDPYIGDCKRGTRTCVGRLANEGPPVRGKRRILVVTHREGIRDLASLAGTPHRRTPYCGIALFGFHRGKAKKGRDGALWRFDGLKYPVSSPAAPALPPPPKALRRV